MQANARNRRNRTHCRLSVRQYEIVPSISAPAAQVRADSLGDDPKVPAQRPVRDVIEVEPHHLLIIQIAPPRDLPGARQTGLRLKAVRVSLADPRPKAAGCRGAGEGAGRQGSSRRQYIDQLRQLVETRAPKEPTQTSDSRVVTQLEEHTARRLIVVFQFGQPIFSIDGHRPELQHAERSSATAAPHLAEEDGTAGVQPDQECDHEHHRRQEQQAGYGPGHVDGALGQQPRGIRREPFGSRHAPIATTHERIRSLLGAIAPNPWEIAAQRSGYSWAHPLRGSVGPVHEARAPARQVHRPTHSPRPSVAASRSVLLRVRP